MTRRSLSGVVSAPVLAAVLFGMAPLAGYGEQNPSESPRAGSPVREEVFHTVVVDGRPMVRLQTGEEYPVLALTPEQKLRAQKQATAGGNVRDRKSAGGAAAYGGVSAYATPAMVDHRRFQGPIRDQGERGTCAAFASIAAVEGCYRRVDPERFRDLDLSEQWTHHIHKMSFLLAKPTKAAYRENEMGGWELGRAYYELLAMQLYGVPTEGALGYNPDPAVERIGDPNDPKFPQWTVDNYNLDASRLPLSALTSAPYRPTGTVFMADEDFPRSGGVESVLAAGYDVVALVNLVSPMDVNAEKAWVAGPNPQVTGGHVVLIVGYNRLGRYYIVRNSWGGRDAVDGQYTRISYDYVEQYGDYGCYVTGVADPDEAGSQGRQYLGRWSIKQWNGELDIYRLPGLYDLDPDVTVKDYRIGTYYEDGRAWRVNGYWWEGQLAFCIDFENPNAPRDALFGNWFAVRVSLLKDDTLQGTAFRDGWREAFEGARKTRTD